MGAINNPVLKVIERAERTVFGPKSPTWNPADAMLAAVVLYPDTMITKEQTYPATVELHGWKTRGELIIDRSNSTTPNARIIEGLDQEFFMNVMLYAAEATKDSFLKK